MKSVIEHGLSTNLHSTTKCLKHSSNFESVENVPSSDIVEFERCHISIVNQLFSTQTGHVLKVMGSWVEVTEMCSGGGALIYGLLLTFVSFIFVF